MFLDRACTNPLKPYLTNAPIKPPNPIMINFDIKADSPGMDFLGVVSYWRLSVDSTAVKTSTFYHSRMEWTKAPFIFKDEKAN